MSSQFGLSPDLKELLDPINSLQSTATDHNWLITGTYCTIDVERYSCQRQPLERHMPRGYGLIAFMPWCWPLEGFAQQFDVIIWHSATTSGTALRIDVIIWQPATSTAGGEGDSTRSSIAGSFSSSAITIRNSFRAIRIHSYRQSLNASSIFSYRNKQIYQQS